MSQPVSWVYAYLLFSSVLFAFWVVLYVARPDIRREMVWVMLGGLVLMGAGWRRIHRARGELVTDGVYARMRHPQYAGLFLITVGMLVQWPTIITVLTWPVLLVVYYRLARREEREAELLFGAAYARYKASVPCSFPGSALSAGWSRQGWTGRRAEPCPAWRMGQ